MTGPPAATPRHLAVMAALADVAADLHRCYPDLADRIAAARAGQPLGPWEALKRGSRLQRRTSPP